MLATPILALLLAGVPGAADTHTLKWKLAAGDVFYARNTITNEQTLEVMGQDLKQTTTKTSIMKFQVKSVKAGVTVVEVTYVDNKADAPNLPGANVANKLKGVSFTLTLDEKLKVTKLEGYDKFVEAAADGNDSMKKVIKATMPEDGIREGAGRIFAIATPRPVAVEDTWMEEDTYNLGLLGVAEIKSTLKLDAVKDNIATISMKGDAIVKPGPAGDAGLPVKFTKVDLKSTKWTAKHLFDMKAGRVTETQMDLELTGTIAIEAANRTTESNVKQKTKLVSAISAKNPLEE